MARRGERAQQPEPQRPELQDIVPHPRYGSAVIPSGTKATAAEVRGSFHGYRKEKIYPESAIPADLTRQNFTTFPRGYYVDTLKVCRDCGRSFLFFAREQQHWYEELGFYIDADCVRCPACRRMDQELAQSRRRYAELVGREDLDDEELATLVEDAAHLWNDGILRDEQKLRWLRNLARRRIPGSRATARIEKILSGLSKPRG
jgi:hypothetical protein